MGEWDAERQRPHAYAAISARNFETVFARIEENAGAIAGAWRHGDPTRGTPKQREALAEAGAQSEEALQALALLAQARERGDVDRVTLLAFRLGAYSRVMDELLRVVHRIEASRPHARTPRTANQERDEQIRAWGLLVQAERQSRLPLPELASRAKAHFKQLPLSQRQLERILAPVFD